MMSQNIILRENYFDIYGIYQTFKKRVKNTFLYSVCTTLKKKKISAMHVFVY